ncbi:MAG: hypothetical protein AAF990_25035 [Bacteroidota bacterium]
MKYLICSLFVLTGLVLCMSSFDRIEESKASEKTALSSDVNAIEKHDKCQAVVSQASISVQQEMRFISESSDGNIPWLGVMSVLLLSFFFVRELSLKAVTTVMALLLFAACSPKTNAPQSPQAKPTSPDSRQANQRGDRGRPQFSDLLARMDRDEDGRLSSSEVQGPLKNDFAKVDTNQDGYLSAEEFKNAPPPRHRQNQ